MWFGSNSSSPWGPYGFQFSNQNSGQLNFHLADDSSGHDLYSSTSLSNSTWYHLVGTYNGTTSKLYVNGSEEASDTVSFTLGNYDTTNGLGIGDKYQTGNEFSGDMDEIRVANAAKSSDWITTEYNNQSSPSAFLTLGSVPSTSIYTSYTYDFRNTLTQTNIGGTVYYYGYDTDGQRVKYQTPSLTTLTPTKEYSLEGSTPVKYIYGNNQLIATVKDTGGSAVVHYAHTDHLTGSSVVSDSSGAQEELLDYYPYGSIRLDEKAGSFGERHQFTGYLNDTDTGLNYAGARYYNADIGRFMAEDAMFLQASFDLSDPQSMNAYAYGRNNPLAYIDPDGNMALPWQSSGSFGAWMGNGGFLYNIYGGNTARMAEIARSVRTNGFTADHAIAFGAELGKVTLKTEAVAAGSLAVGAGAGVAVNTGAASALFNSQAAVRGTINTALNVGNQIIEDKIEGTQTSAGDYAKIVGLSYAGGAILGNKGIKTTAVGMSGLSAVTQRVTGDGKVNAGKVAGAGLGGAFGSWAGNYAGKTFGLGAYTAQEYGLGRIGWAVEAPISVFSSGFKNRKEGK